MFSTPDAMARSTEGGRSWLSSLCGRLVALFGATGPRHPVLDPAYLSEGMLRDLNLPADLRSGRDWRMRL